ncbi:hypothetical protein SCT_2725 [Sulfuricella sp. T08]|uniref:DUF2189 domain-containing protein n=1 Tax=Sulfuricella sp. T08 TaxID=1632857 RepID=UPI0006179F01|nr:DUF2189 domain-containing protein [Sulfuricella sp. T08]GAO37304.1 hypothetical protein SCT_2725 [Sulfuricella sp. T08]
MEQARNYRKVTFPHIRNWIAHGWRMFRQTQIASIAYAGIFAVIGTILLIGAVKLDVAPMAFPLAGGFMLIGPAFLAGFFHVASLRAQQRPVRFADFFRGFRHGPAALWVISVICAFLFLVWLTDAAIVYSLYFGTSPMLGSLELITGLGEGGKMLSFVLFCSLTGSVLAFMIFAISAFSVPLIFSRHVELANAVGTSVRAVFANFGVMIAWGIILTAGIVGTTLLFMPLFVMVFPVLAYASERAYRDVCA